MVEVVGITPTHSVSEDALSLLADIEEGVHVSNGSKLLCYIPLF